MNFKDRFFSSAAWTGRSEELTVAERVDSVHEVVEVIAPEPPEPVPYIPIQYEPVSLEMDAYTPEQLKEYSEIASLVGVAPLEFVVEEFKTYLSTKEFPVFDLATVIAFMDAKSKNEGNGWGWNWLPLREKDRVEVSFGQEATRREMSMAWGASSTWIGEDRPASDHYASHRWGSRMIGASPTPIYSKIVPLHALKKVAMIEKEFGHTVSFMVCDYAPAPAFRADPFLMVVIPNSRLNEGYGRFVIDVWDEPGFGIDKMLK